MITKIINHIITTFTQFFPKANLHFTFANAKNITFDLKTSKHIIIDMAYHKLYVLAFRLAFRNFEAPYAWAPGSRPIDHSTKSFNPTNLRYYYYMNKL